MDCIISLNLFFQEKVFVGGRRIEQFFVVQHDIGLYFVKISSRKMILDIHSILTSEKVWILTNRLH